MESENDALSASLDKHKQLAVTILECITFLKGLGVPEEEAETFVLKIYELGYGYAIERIKTLMAMMEKQKGDI